MIYQKILLPVSGKYNGERTTKALNHALGLVQGEIILMHVYAPLPQIVGGEAHQELVRDAEAKSMTTLAPMVSLVEKTGMPCRTRIAHGPIADAIVHVAHEEQCDMIVMFTDGRDEVSDMLLGSITERVLRSTDVPLLAIRR